MLNANMLIFLAILFLSHFGWADYRAYELAIDNLENGKSRKVISTLDQYQYATYYPLDPGDQIKYVRSWKCWGTTDYHSSICAAPGENPSTPKPISSPAEAPVQQN